MVITKLIRRCFILFILALSAALLGSLPVSLADGPIGTGTPESCDDAAILAALPGGGTFTFNCGPNPHTIIASTYVIDTDTTIDGGGLITLNGEQLRQVFLVMNGATLTLNNLVIAQGGWSGNGGAIANSGTLILNNSTVRDSYSESGYGGGIYNTGLLTINNSQILGNATGPGYAGGGIDNNNGTVTVINSVIRGNSSPYGGGIDSVGTLTISSSLIMENRASVALGGGLDVGGLITIENSTIDSNSAVQGGAGLNATAAADMTISNSTISNNVVDAAVPSTTGGGILNAGHLTLRGVTLERNAAFIGGGLYNQTTQAVTIEGTTLANNAATGDDGGGIYTGAGSLNIVNTTFYRNTSANYGGGLQAAIGSIQVKNSTFDHNSAQQGGGLYKTDGATLTMANTIIAHSTGGDCALQNPLISNGYNLTDDATCGLTGTGDAQNTDPQLTSLAYNGGPTFTQRPQPNSPAIDVVPAANCPTVDQRGVVRPQGSACDVGAVELEADGVPLACGGVFNPVADATISQNAPDTNSGQEATLYLNHGGNANRYPLLAFDLGSTLPPGAAIAEATLEVSLLSPPNPTTYALTYSEIIAPWSEGSVTWNTRPAVGTDYGTTIYQIQEGVLQIDVTPLAVRWATDAVSQAGLMLHSTGSEAVNLTLASREVGVDSPMRPRLVIRCGPPIAPPPTNETSGNQSQAAGLNQLQQASTGNDTLQFGPGYLRFGDFLLTIPANIGSDPLAQAEWFLNEYRNLLRLSDPDSELQLLRRSDDGLHLVFRQRHKGIPVYGAELVVHLGEGQVLGMNGSYVPNIILPEIPTLTAEAAETLALADVEPTTERTGDIQLRYLNLALLGIENGGTHLAWQVNRLVGGGPESVFVDAHDGAILFVAPGIMEGFDLDLEDGNNERPQDLCGLFDNDNIDPGDAPPDSQNAANHARTVYDYWRNNFGRDSYDNDGEQIELNIHVNSPNNASYSGCDIFFFGYGMTTLDITSHEFSHAVDASEGNLIYRNQSGALDESFADIFGSMLDNNWTIGEGSAAGIIRDMSNPPAYGDPDQIANYVNTTADNGGVHTNSGIHNKAAFLTVQGGSFNSYTVRGIGRFKAQRLYHNVLTNRIWSSAQLIDARNLAVAEAGDLVRSGTFTSSDLCSVRNAYAAVGLGSGDRDCDNIEDNVDPDQDGDYIANNVDNCATVFNPFQNDLDGDGQGDACDSDMDGDGRANNQDNCSTVFNPGQQDWNLDGAGDVCDDTDGDSITDNRDNCRTIWNFDQKDQDFDGIGDACDSDIDGDGWGNTWDNCPIHRNPGQEDTTETAIGQPKDGIGDVCDLCPAVSSTDNTDLDGDGLANPCDPDDDGDGWDDGLDNCPVNANPTQFDWDKNGVGFVCDANEQKKFGDLLSDINNRYAVQLSDFHMPIPICPECVGNYLPHDFQSVINVQLPVAFKAQVVNSNGVVVAKGIGSSLNQSLWVSPVSFALTPQFGPRAVQRSQNPALAAEPAPDETFYYLEIVPEPGTDLSQTYQLGISVQGEVKGHKIYLPLVKK